MGEDQLTLAIRRFCHGTVMLAPSILNFCCSFLKPKTLTTKAKHQPKDPTPLNQNPRAANPETAEAEDIRRQCNASNLPETCGLDGG